MTMHIVGSIDVASLTPDQLAQVLAWRQPTNFRHPFQGKAEVWGPNGAPGKLFIIPEDRLGICERRRRGFLAADDAEWLQYCREFPNHVPSDLREVAP